MFDIPSESVVFAALLAGAVVKLIFGTVARKNRRQKMVKVGTVTQLMCYPVKSCRGITSKEGLCTRLGLWIGKAADRHWMVVRSNGDFVTQRQFPRMVLIQSEVGSQELVLKAPDMPSLTLPLCPVTDRSHVIKCRVWEERTEGLDCGDDAAYWVSTFLKIPGLRMVFSAPDILRKDLTRTQALPWDNLSLPGDQAAFSDFGAYLITTEESLRAVNEKLTEKVTMERFRPNLVISGQTAFDEDNWSELQIGESATFRMLHPCTRCTMTTVNPDTGEKHPKSQPLETLKSFRCVPQAGTSPLFGVNAAADCEGVVRVGDPVYAIYK